MTTLPDMIGLDTCVAFFSSCSGNTPACGNLREKGTHQVPYEPGSLPSISMFPQLFKNRPTVVHTDKNCYFPSGSSSSDTVGSIQ